MANNMVEEEEGDIVFDIESLSKGGSGDGVDKRYPLPVSRVIPWYPSVTERYYKPYFYVPSDDLLNQMSMKSSGRHIVSDQCILFHSNRFVQNIICFHPFSIFEIQFESFHLTNERVVEN